MIIDKRKALALGLLLGLTLGGGPGAHAALIEFFVTGDDPGTAGEDIFRVTADTSVALSATPVSIITDPRSLDGINFLPGAPSEVSVGARTLVPGGGSIAHFDVRAPATLPDLLAATNAPAPAPAPAGPASSPSSIFNTATHVYYTENQFGFAATTDHRIMRVDRGTGAASVVFDGGATGAGGLENFEGLEIIDGKLYFFARDTAVGMSDKRALYSIGLDGAGVWDGAAPTHHLGGLFATPTVMTGAADGSDEIAFSPDISLLGGGAGTLFGSNILNGEVVYLDVGTGTGGFLIGPTDFSSFPGPDSFDVLESGAVDGIRAFGGELVFTGRAGVIGAIDILGAFAGADPGDVTPLYDASLGGPALVFDDLTLVGPVPEPTSLALFALGLAGLGFRRGFDPGRGRAR